DFLQHLDGMPVSIRVANGYFAGRTFVHPDFDILIAFPEGWPRRNAPDGALAAPSQGDAVIMLSLAGEGDDPMVGARSMAKEVGEGLMAQVEQTKIGALPAARTVFRARSDKNELGIDVTWVAYRGHVFQIIGVTSVEELTAYQRPFQMTRESFRPLTA